MKCTITNCDCLRHHRGTGYCLKHYACWKRTGDPIPRKKPHKFKTCTIEGCVNPHRRRGFCVKHSARVSRHGDPHKLGYFTYENDEQRHAAIKASKKKYQATFKGKLAGRLKRQRRRAHKNDDMRLTSSQAAIVLDIFHNRCLRCLNADDLTFDHHMPLNFGGKLGVDNVTVLCRTCNGQKSDFDPSVFYTPKEFARAIELLKKSSDYFSSLPLLYLLYGTYGVGKTHLTKSLKECFRTIHHDGWKIKEELYVALGVWATKALDKPILLETPRDVTRIINRLAGIFNVKMVLMDETEDVLRERLTLRGGSLTDHGLHQKQRYLRYYRRFGGFKGTSDECLAYLRSQVQTHPPLK